MFRKREKKIFPPGTFIEPKARIAAIIQLCFAFSMLLWIASQPFMGDLFAIRSEMKLIETIFGTRASLPTDSEGLLQRNQQRFENLADDEKALIYSHYENLQQLSKTSFIKKFKTTAKLLTTDTQPFILAAIIFSIAIPILLLLRYEGAVASCFLLPLLIFCALLDNTFHGKNLTSADSLYPLEQEILQKHVKEPLKTSIIEQYAQLTKGWQHFLIVEWAKESPSESEVIFQKQLENGEFAFNVAQAKNIASKGFTLPSSLKGQKISSLLLASFLFMSFCLAIAAAFSKRKNWALSKSQK